VTRHSRDEQPTRVLPPVPPPAQAPAEQPTVTTAPATRRARVWRHVPSRLGRARTSTVVIGCLFVLLFGVYSTVKPAQGYQTFTDPTSGVTYRVPIEDVSPAPATTAPATTAGTPPSTSVPDPRPSTTAPSSAAVPGTTAAPRTSAGTTATTAPPASRSTPSRVQDETTPATTPSREPATTAEPSATEESGAGATSSAPTG